jgi:hypothetical protein
MSTSSCSNQPVIMFRRHQYQFPPAMPSDLHRLTSRLVLNLPEITLEFDSRCLSNHEPSKSRLSVYYRISGLVSNAATALPARPGLDSHAVVDGDEWEGFEIRAIQGASHLEDQRVIRALPSIQWRNSAGVSAGIERGSGGCGSRAVTPGGAGWSPVRSASPFPQRPLEAAYEIRKPLIEPAAADRGVASGYDHCVGHVQASRRLERRPSARGTAAKSDRLPHDWSRMA